MGYRYLNGRFNSTNDVSISCKNFVHFGPVTPEKTGLICILFYDTAKNWPASLAYTRHATLQRCRVGVPHGSDSVREHDPLRLVSLGGGACFFGGCLLALNKISGGIRPIAIGFTLRRLTSKCAIAYGVNHLRSFFQPRQLGVGTPGRCEAAIHSARHYLEA